MRTIGICGHDFCGSTLLSRLFAAIPSVASGGELRWLVNDPGNRGRCSVCGPDCDVFTEDLISGLSPKTLYEQVCEAFGRDTLVSSDKGCKHYQRFVRKGEMTGIILFRSLLGVASSDRKHQMVWPFVPRASVNKSIEGWINVYRKFLEWAPEFCEDYIFLSYEGLVADHVGVMTRLCERIGVQLDGAFPSGPLVAEYHNVLGNPSAHDSRKVCADESWKKRLTAEEQLCIRKHTTAQEIYKKMRKQAIA